LPKQKSTRFGFRAVINDRERMRESPRLSRIVIGRGAFAVAVQSCA
jgi:hypothetical protein